MNRIQIIERGMTDAEFARMNAGFDEHTREHHNPIENSERHSFVLLDEDTFVGCSSGLLYRNGETYNGWFYLTDMFVEKDYRKQGFGAALLRQLEDSVAALGAANFWTITAGYEAPGFYQKQGYTVFCEQAHWYSTGHSRVMLQKLGMQKVVGN